MKSVKLVIVFFLLSVVSLQVNGQNEKKKYIAGSNFSMNLSNYKDIDNDKFTEFEISPNFGFFIGRNFVLGLQIPLNISSTRYESGYKETIHSYTIAPFMRLYLGNDKVVKPFLQTDIGFGSMNKKEFNETGTETEANPYNVFLYEFSTGLAFVITENLYLNFQLGYEGFKAKPKSDNPDKTVIEIKGIDFQIGFSILL